jgi:spermidine synthase
MVSVVEVVPYRQKFLTTNRLYTQNTSSMERTEDHRRLGHIPLLLHPEAKSVLVIGLGAGMTLSGAGVHPAERIDVVELSANVAAAADLFKNENGGILDDSRVTLHIADGRHYIQAGGGRYDVIIGDIYFPMSSGSSHMYSVDYYRMVQARLHDDGLFMQWLPIHQLTLDDLKTVIRSFREAFPYASLWYGMIGDSAPAVGVAGARKPLVIDFGQLEKRMAMPSIHGPLAAVNLGNPNLLLSHYIASNEAIDEWVEGAPVNSDNRPIIEYSTPRIYQRAYELGLDNLSTLTAIAQDVSTILTGVPPEESERTAAELAAHAEAKKLVIRQLKQLSDGERSLQTIAQGLMRDPDNEDLLYWYNRLASQGY